MRISVCLRVGDCIGDCVCVRDRVDDCVRGGDCVGLLSLSLSLSSVLSLVPLFVLVLFLVFCVGDTLRAGSFLPLCGNVALNLDDSVWGDSVCAEEEFLFSFLFSFPFLFPFL